LRRFPTLNLTPEERVLVAVNHQEPDWVPIVIGVSTATGIEIGVYQRLTNHLGIEAENRYLYDWPEMGSAKRRSDVAYVALV
jgi:uroporphyrinogen decarboxylase